jgi:hypothetical protein
MKCRCRLLNRLIILFQSYAACGCAEENEETGDTGLGMPVCRPLRAEGSSSIKEQESRRFPLGFPQPTLGKTVNIHWSRLHLFGVELL